MPATYSMRYELAPVTGIQVKSTEVGWLVAPSPGEVNTGGGGTVVKMNGAASALSNVGASVSRALTVQVYWVVLTKVAAGTVYEFVVTVALIIVPGTGGVMVISYSSALSTAVQFSVGVTGCPMPPLIGNNKSGAGMIVLKLNIVEKAVSPPPEKVPLTRQ